MIEVSNLTKNYGGFQAVHDVSFKVEKDSVLGFLGPNGAGKTTIMKILTGYHYPSAGEARIDGISVTEDPVAVKRRIGYLPESVPLYGDLTIDEYLRFVADARLIPANRRGRSVENAIERCGLGKKRGKRIETLSKGYKQRTGLAQAILHDPDVLILDEPTSGLDPNQIIEIRSLIRELGRTKTVILSTHILQEVDAVCNQVLILNEGRIAAQGTPESIASTIKGGENWDLLLKGTNVDAARTGLETLGLAVSINTIEENADGTVHATFFIPSANAGSASNSSAERIFDWAVANNMKILAMDKKKLSMEDIFVKLTA